MPRARRLGHEPQRLTWCAKFRNRGYRFTAARQTILDILHGTSEHLSAEDIYFIAHKIEPNIGLTTVYRTLEMLTRLGLIVKFDFGDDRARYELTEDRHGLQHHHHLVCTGCGRVIDYSDFINEELELVRRTEKGLAAKFGFKIASHIIQFRGLCGRCRKT